jgi:hypothetical protein
VLSELCGPAKKPMQLPPSAISAPTLGSSANGHVGGTPAVPKSLQSKKHRASVGPMIPTSAASKGQAVGGTENGEKTRGEKKKSRKRAASLGGATSTDDVPAHPPAKKAKS